MVTTGCWEDDGYREDGPRRVVVGRFVVGMPGHIRREGRVVTEFVGAEAITYRPLANTRLSAGERAVMDDFCRGDTQEAISRRRGVSLRTVASMVSRAYDKVGYRSRREACAALANAGDD
jgi:DNA-binding NarL/FixJ family response regulator